jgi:hypothetical protein
MEEMLDKIAWTLLGLIIGGLIGFVGATIQFYGLPKKKR